MPIDLYEAIEEYVVIKRKKTGIPVTRATVLVFLLRKGLASVERAPKR